jgi:thiazole synthase
MSDPLIIAGRAFQSRLIVGTGKYKSFQETARALDASGAEIVTVAVRRVNLDRSKESLLDYIDPKKYFLLPNTAGCYTADEAIRAARLGREVGISDWVKIEVIGDQATLYPDVQATLEATRVLVKEGFTVLPYTSDDVVFAKRLLDAGAATIMPLGAPIGSGLGIQNRANLQILREMIIGVPLIVDAGVGTASDGDGTGSRCCLDEHWNSRGAGPCADGRRHETCRRCWSTGLPRRTHGKEALRDREFPARRGGPVANAKRFHHRDTVSQRKQKLGFLFLLCLCGEDLCRREETVVRAISCQYSNFQARCARPPSCHDKVCFFKNYTIEPIEPGAVRA